MTDVAIRASRTDDWDALEAVYQAAFPEEELTHILKVLLAKPEPFLSLTAEKDGLPIGHVAFSPCGLTEANVSLSLLGPLAVHPDVQARGIGSALVRAGFDRLKKSGVSTVLVLGDPGYYGRFGFLGDHAIDPPYDLPAEWDGAWQAVDLLDQDSDLAGLAGRLMVPDPWRDQKLWLP